ncbi:BlaI/MecI/CopY family transcriptional regulator [Flammeovirgaceae bacterium SG7u.111]|nr:BlaI/MecI/CopY family transcriptional regulator [Flammeovirgaceae bacterium SG7u.132]WPO35878.1 BlaI/MecI/CopY family transcriptional regulator [Flammeovirgaceae bacterium SG7u.111]
MAKKEKSLKPTEAELEVLQVLWSEGASTVRFVHEKINETKEVGYTTTLKILQNMLEKGLVMRDEQSRTHIYKAAVAEQDIQKKLLDRFLETTFGGSALKLVMQALGNNTTTQDELAQIREFLNEKEGGKK